MKTMGAPNYSLPQASILLCAALCLNLLRNLSFHSALPRILETPVDITQNETEDARFSCAGDGIPTPQVTWRKNGEEIKNSTKNDINTVEERLHFQKSNLTIKNLTYADRGNYSCTLSNRKGAHVEDAVLVVHGKLMKEEFMMFTNLPLICLFSTFIISINPEPDLTFIKYLIWLANSFSNYITLRVSKTQMNSLAIVSKT